ncbi:MAG: hypothetical protein HY315_06430 [Acidobacteria bacterium]|nr:hypothetical protein [Acidobacteriota bacterium]
MNLESADVPLDLQRLDSEGRQAAGARLDGANSLKAGGHLARFVPEFEWSPKVDFSDFAGVLRVTSSGKIAATVVRVQPGRFATLPVAPK